MKRNISYLFLLLFFSIAALYTGDKVFYMIAGVLVLIPLLSLIMLLLMVLRCKYSEEIKQSLLIRGEYLKYSLHIRNRDILLYPYVKVNFFTDNFFTEQIFNSEVFYILPFRNYKIEKEIYCEHIGVYTIGIKSLEFKDFFGFFRWTLFPKVQPKKIQVVPKPVELHSFKILTGYGLDSVRSVNKPGMEDYSEIAEIHKYTPGIPLKRVHWKLSAKRDELMAKKYYSPYQQDVFIFVDISDFYSVSKNNLFKRDIIIESAIAIMRYCLKNTFSVILCFNDMTSRKIKVVSAHDFQYVSDELLHMDTKAHLPFNAVLAMENMGWGQSGNAIIITGSLTASIYDAVARLQKSGHNTAFIYAAGEEDMGNSSIEHMMENMKLNGTAVYKVNHADSIKKVLEM
ncbi:MAG: DUF58 domain-containing protein [Clostridiaceae bacterium]|nr:DUF58 domain-containing protein [Clostridiaceae bacterium]